MFENGNISLLGNIQSQRDPTGQTETGGTIVEPIPCSGVKMAVDSDNDDKQY